LTICFLLANGIIILHDCDSVKMAKTDYDPDGSLVLIEGVSHFLTNFLQNLASCQTSFSRKCIDVACNVSVIRFSIINKVTTTVATNISISLNLA
jgi:hypothetical protein